MHTAVAKEVGLNHSVTSKASWVEQRKALLAREKELTRLHDQIALERRALPWVRVEKDYMLDTPEGTRSLAELFEGRRQLIIQHFMFTPGHEQGCVSCSYMADHTDGALAHLAQRDVTFVAVSRAPLSSIARFRQRMGWQFKWVSSGEGDFNFDFDVSFTPEDMATGEVYYNYCRQAFHHPDAPGVSVFYKDDAGEVYHTYSTYGRGVEVMMHTYNFLDLTPKGPRRGGWNDGLGAPSRPLRAGADREGDRLLLPGAGLIRARPDRVSTSCRAIGHGWRWRESAPCTG